MFFQNNTLFQNTFGGSVWPFELVCVTVTILLQSANTSHFLCKHEEMSVLYKTNNKQQTAMKLMLWLKKDSAI